jgi:hypothetical protein
MPLPVLMYSIYNIYPLSLLDYTSIQNPSNVHVECTLVSRHFYLIKIRKRLQEYILALCPSDC